MDNDTYGHVNNVTYYSYFDTVVNEHLVRAGGLDIHNAPAIGLVVETSCRFHRPLSFPDTVDAGTARGEDRQLVGGVRNRAVPDGTTRRPPRPGASCTCGSSARRSDRRPYRRASVRRCVGCWS